MRVIWLIIGEYVIKLIFIFGLLCVMFVSGAERGSTQPSAANIFNRFSIQIRWVSQPKCLLFIVNFWPLTIRFVRSHQLSDQICFNKYFFGG